MIAVSDVARISSSPTAPPPCAAAPERWLDRRDRTEALTTCLRCPVRRWCAQEALSVKATWGMWAGIWIDGRHSEVADSLRAIAVEPMDARPTVGADTTMSELAPGNRPPLPRGRLGRSGRAQPVSALVLGRSSGQCEIFGAGCQLVSDVQCSRVVGMSTRQASSASSIFAACRRCSETLGTAPEADLEALGYVIESPGRASSVPFRWRGARWVLLEAQGALRQVHGDSQTAQAC